MVAALRISGRRLRRAGDERDAITDWRVAQAEREEFKQSHAASLLQRILLFASHVAGAGAGIGGEAVTGILVRR